MKKTGGISGVGKEENTCEIMELWGMIQSPGSHVK